MPTSIEQLLQNYVTASQAKLATNSALAGAQTVYSAALAAFLTAELTHDQGQIDQAATAVLTANTALLAAQDADSAATVAFITAQAALLSALSVPTGPGQDLVAQGTKPKRKPKAAK